LQPLQTQQDRHDLTGTLEHLHLLLDAASMPLLLDAEELDWLIEHLTTLRDHLQWRFGRTQWRALRVKSPSKRANKWHLLPWPWQGKALCSDGPCLGTCDCEVADSPLELWDPTLCQHCVLRWTQLIHRRVVRYHPVPPTAGRATCTGHDSDPEGLERLEDGR
jgi:hypothetical protein